MSKFKKRVHFMDQKIAKDGKTKYMQTKVDMTMHTENGDIKFPKGSFVNLNKKPTDEDINGAVSENQAAFLEKRQANWPEWLTAEFQVEVKE
jgi:hypothetical protein